MVNIYAGKCSTGGGSGPATCAPVEYHALTIDLDTPGAPLEHVYLPAGSSITFDVNQPDTTIWNAFVPAGCSGPNLSFDIDGSNVTISF